MFFTLRLCKSYTHSVETLDFEFGSFQVSDIGLYSLMMLCRIGHAAPSQPRDAEGRGPTLHSVPCCQHFEDICVLCFGIMSKKCPCMSPTSGEKRKAITLEMELKIIAQHEGSKP